MRSLQVAMRRGSAMLCLLMGAPLAFAAPAIVQTQQPRACATITSRDLQNAGSGDSVAEIVRKLPVPGGSSTQNDSACPQPKNPSPQPLTPWDQRILDIQNAERAAVGVPPLKWNSQLAANATAWAQQLARNGQVVHAPREGRGIERENLQKGLIAWGPDRVVQDWINEKRVFRPGIYPNVCDGDWTQCAHYTQIIWVTTIDIGCGKAVDIMFVYEVCRYSPGGNKPGKPVGIQKTVGNSPVIAASNPPTFAPVADASGPSLPTLRTDANGDADTKVPPPDLWAKKDEPAKPMKPSVDLVSDLIDSAGETLSGGVGADAALQTDTAQSEVGPDEISGGAGADTAKADNPASGPLLYDNGALGDGLIYGNIGTLGDIPGITVLPAVKPVASGLDAQKCPVDFGAEGLSRELDQAEVELNKKLAAGAWIDPAEYQKLAEQAEQSKQAAMEEDRATGGTVDPTLFNQNSDKAQRLLKTAEAAAAAQTVDTNVEPPNVQGTPALIDPNAPSPIDLKLSDCVM
jgi:hypothetical protein